MATQAPRRRHEPAFSRAFTTCSPAPMADVPVQRKKLVQTLRACARACAVPLVCDDAAQERVAAFAAAIAASAGPAQQKAATRTAYVAYVRLRLAAEPPAPQVCDAAARPRADDFRLRGKSFLVAYNWDFFNAAFSGRHSDGGEP